MLLNVTLRHQLLFLFQTFINFFLFFFLQAHSKLLESFNSSRFSLFSVSKAYLSGFFFNIPIIFSHVVINLSLSNNNFYLHIINQNVFIYTKPRSTSDCPWGSVIIICIISVLAMVDIFKKAHEKKTSNPEPLKSKFEYYFGHTTL